MTVLILPALIVLSMILVNAFFAGAEIALVSLKRARLALLMESHPRRAAIIADIKSNADTFFATVQIGVTLAGTVAGVYSGSELLEIVVPMLEGIESLTFIRTYLEQITLAVLVFSITYMQIVIGELVPKSLALHHAAGYALTAAYPLRFFSKIFYPLTMLFTITSNLVLRPFRDRTTFSETRFQEEEIRELLREGVRVGTIGTDEHQIINNVFEIDDTSAREIMVPRVDMQAIDLDSREDLDHLIDFQYSRAPAYRGSPDHIMGIMYVRDYIRAMARKEMRGPESLLRPAYFVPESMKIDRIMKEMQRRRTSMAVVVDEYGVTAGLLTMEDIIEEIVGEIEDRSEAPEEGPIVQIDDRIFNVAGSCPIGDFNEYFQTMVIPESGSYNSVAGFMIEQLGRFPEVGERVHVSGHVFELVKRVRQQLVSFRFERAEKLPNGENSDVA